MTIALNEQLATLPAASMAMYVTTVLPMCRTAMGAWLDVRLVTPTLSEAVGATQNGVPVAMPCEAEVTALGGHPIRTGLSLSEQKRESEKEISTQIRVCVNHALFDTTSN